MDQLTDERIKEIFDAHRHRVEDCDSGVDDDNLLEFVSAILAEHRNTVLKEARGALKTLDDSCASPDWISAIESADDAIRALIIDENRDSAEPQS